MTERGDDHVVSPRLAHIHNLPQHSFIQTSTPCWLLVTSMHAVAVQRQEACNCLRAIKVHAAGSLHVHHRRVVPAQPAWIT